VCQLYLNEKKNKLEKSMPACQQYQNKGKNNSIDNSKNSKINLQVNVPKIYEILMAESKCKYMTRYICLVNVKSHFQKYSSYLLYNYIQSNLNNIPQEFFMELTK